MRRTASPQRLNRLADCATHACTAEALEPRRLLSSPVVKMVSDVPGTPNFYVFQAGMNGNWFGVVDDGVHGAELWFNDGTRGSMRLLKDLSAHDSFLPEDLRPIGDTLYFTQETAAYGRELWKTDGTPEGTQLVKDVVPGPAWSNLDHLTDFNGQLWFTARIGSAYQMWKSDGTEAGTVKAFDLPSNIGAPVVAGDEMFYTGLQSPLAPLYATNGGAPQHLVNINTFESGLPARF